MIPDTTALAQRISEQTATWDRLEREALTDPYLHKCVTLAHYYGREAALIAVVLALAAQNRQDIAREVERLQNTVPCRYCGNGCRAWERAEGGQG